jgi:cellulose synthase/poly-beta-1,6-N-acetylglucosamine synthase-like glycosyltransferase
VNPWITAAAVVVGLPGGAAVLHLSLLTAASLAYREPRPMSGAPRLRFLTLVPARNEATVLPETLARMVAQCREGDRVLVVADHCSDGTVAVAREAGADVFERSTGLPGRAAARQAGLDHVRSWQWDAIAMVDADCIVEPGFLAACERALVGADVLQVRAEAEHAGGFFPRMTTVAFAIQGVVVPRGRDRLRLSVRLRGMGMVMRRAIVERYSFRAEGASEDLWYSLDLCLDGIHPRHADSARLRARSVRSRGGATEQRTRWEAGRMAAAREFVPRLLRRHDRASLEAAWYLLSPPLAVSVLSLLGAAALAWVGGGVWLLGTALGLVALLAVDLVIALLTARVEARTWLALCAAPAYIAWKAWIQLRAAGRVLRARTDFPPTPRE